MCLGGWELPLPAAKVPDWLEQAARRHAFQAAHPEMALQAVGGRAQATIPVPGRNGSRTIMRESWREVLDVLGAPADADP